MEFLKQIYYSTKKRSKTPKKKKEPYDYKTDVSNNFVRTNLLFTILLNKGNTL